MAKITILGAGGFGVSLAIAAYQNQHQVTVWDISEEIVQANFATPACHSASDDCA